MLISLVFWLSAVGYAAAMEYRCGDTRVADPSACAPNTKCEFWGKGGWAPCAQQSVQSDALPEEPSPGERCRANLKCWAESVRSYAYVDCAAIIEKRAKYESRWETGWFESKFDHYGWANERLGTVVYYGDKISMQNGFGAWQKMKYACTYDPEQKTVLNVEIGER